MHSIHKEDINHILKQKKLQLVFLFYVLLILPLLTPLAQNIPVKEVGSIMIINTLFFISFSIFSCFLPPRAEKVLYTLLLAFSMIPGTMFLGYLIFARVLLEQNSITSLFETNAEESKEFVMHYFNMWVIGGVLIYIIIPVVMILKMRSYRPLRIKRYKVAFIVSLTAILSIVFISKLSQSVYFLKFYHTYAAYKIRLYNEKKAIANRQSYTYSVEKIVPDSVPQTLVVVIGESLTRHHMQLYGYGRNTTPLLSAKNDSVIVYTNVISPQVHTIPVIRSILSFYERENHSYFETKPSLFELFNRAGYETYFISNQAFGGKFGTSYDVLLELAQHKTDLSPNKAHDGIVLNSLKNILSKPNEKNRLIVIHLIGNHMAYKFRYPEDFAVFNHQKDNFVKSNKFRNKDALKAIDEYDNSVLYNDYVIAQIINTVNQEAPDNASVVYFSDHGEELFDFRNFAGHAYEKLSPYMCEVPFIVWMSDSFRTNRKDITIDANRPYSTADFIFSISNLAGINYKDYDESRSIFSDKFNPRKRFVGDVPYDELIYKRN